MEIAHNHPPACCCQGEFTDCPRCPEHAPPAQIGNTEPEYPCCHQLVGRPHTDFCTFAPGAVWGAVFPPPSIEPQTRPACSTPTRDMGDGRGCGDWECPRHGNPEWQLTPDDREAIETALQAAERGDAGHWPTVASWLALEIRRLRGDQP